MLNGLMNQVDQIQEDQDIKVRMTIHIEEVEVNHMIGFNYLII
jgi:hypothetical protein